MGKSQKRKLKLLAPGDQGAAVLRALADGLESGTFDLDGDRLPLEGFTSLAVSLKPGAEGLGVKLKVRFPAPEEPEECAADDDADDADDDDDDDDDDGDDDDDDDDDGDDDDDQDAPTTSGASPPGGKQPKYSSLKKWMKKEFKAITAELLQGRLPEAGLAASFVEDSRQMVRYPGKGDEYYPAFSAATDAFERAMAAGDLEGVAAAVADLRALKDVCHDKYE